MSGFKSWSVRSTVCPHPRSLHTGHSPKQRSRYPAGSKLRLLQPPPTWRLKNSFSNLHIVEISKFGAVGKLVKPSIFQVDACGFNSRRHCQILLILEQPKTSIGRLAYQRGQLSVKQPLLALQVRLLPDLPIMESKSIRRSALFAKQMDEQIVVRVHCSPPLRTWCNWMNTSVYETEE